MAGKPGRGPPKEPQAQAEADRRETGKEHEPCEHGIVVTDVCQAAGKLQGMPTVP